MQNKSKLNTILLVIIIILLVVGLVYIFFNNSKQKEENNLVNNLSQTSTPTTTPTQTPDKTADWVTYTNTTYGYSIKYPSNWLYKEVDSWVGFDDHLSEGGYAWGVEVSGVDIKDRNATYVQKINEFNDRKDFKKENIIINGIPALLVTFNINYSDSVQKKVYIEKDNKTYEISGMDIYGVDSEAFYNSFRFIK